MYNFYKWSYLSSESIFKKIKMKEFELKIYFFFTIIKHHKKIICTNCIKKSTEIKIIVNKMIILIMWVFVLMIKG